MEDFGCFDINPTWQYAHEDAELPPPLPPVLPLLPVVQDTGGHTVKQRSPNLDDEWMEQFPVLIRKRHLFVPRSVLDECGEADLAHRAGLDSNDDYEETEQNEDVATGCDNTEGITSPPRSRFPRSKTRKKHCADRNQKLEHGSPANNRSDQPMSSHGRRRGFSTAFYHKVLDSSAVLGKLVDISSITRFRDRHEYFEMWGSFALAEARALVAQARAKNRSRSNGHKSVKLIIDSTRVIQLDVGEMTEITCQSLGGGLASRQLQKGNVYRMQSTIGSHSGFLGVLLDVEQDGGRWRLLCCSDCRAEGNQEFFALHLESLVSYERMSAVCAQRPNVEFLYRLLGDSPPTHTFFESDSSDSDAPPELQNTKDPCAKPRHEQGLGSSCSLNDSQRNAFKTCLAAAYQTGGFELVQGPPGCGKTRFLAALVAELAAKGNFSNSQRVLVSAPSNKGVTVALLALAQEMTRTNTSIRIALLGVEDTIIETCASDSDAKDVICSSLVYSFLDRLADKIDEILKVEQWSSDCSVGISSVSDVASVMIYVRQQLLSRCPQFCKKVKILQFLNSLDEKVKICNENSGGSLQQQLRNAVLSSCKTLVMNLRKAHKAATADLYLELLNSAQVVFATLSTSGGSLAKRMAKVDVLVVDEAAQALEPELLVALVTKPRSAIIIGDPQQLPATMFSANATLGYGRSAMERLISSSKQKYSMLSIQYRMHRQIVQFPSRSFYDSRLQCDESIFRRSGPFDAIFADASHSDWPCPYCFINVEGPEKRTNSLSLQNTAEVLVIVKLLQRMENEFKIKVAKNFVVISFYQAQCDLLRQLLRKKFVNPPAVHTVDSFQGSEAEAVVVSFVRCNKKQNLGFVEDYRRLNVALTRAKHMMILVGSIATLLSSTSFLNLLVVDAKIRGVVFDTSNLSD